MSDGMTQLKPTISGHDDCGSVRSIGSLEHDVARQPLPTLRHHVLDNSEPGWLTGLDTRADDKSRKVRLSRDRITIDRSYCGVAMRLSIPVDAYQGVCVGLRRAHTGGVTYELRLAHRDAELSVSLAEAPDDREIWADWQSWARFFGLPTLIERNEGLVEWGHAPRGVAARDASASPAASLPASRRRRKRRHAAFIDRRRGSSGVPGAIHREAEIIARD